MILNIILMSIGVYFIIIGMINNCRNEKSKFLLKALPVIFGIYCIFHSAVNFGWLSI